MHWAEEKLNTVNQAEAILRVAERCPDKTLMEGTGGVSPRPRQVKRTCVS